MIFYCSMDGLRVVRLNEVVRTADIFISCTGVYGDDNEIQWSLVRRN